jgi:hypothetical protein
MTALFQLHLAEEHNSVSGRKFRIRQLKQNAVVQRGGSASLLCSWQTHIQTFSLAVDSFTAVYGQIELQIKPRYLPRKLQLFDFCGSVHLGSYVLPFLQA